MLTPSQASRCAPLASALQSARPKRKGPEGPSRNVLPCFSSPHVVSGRYAHPVVRSDRAKTAVIAAHLPHASFCQFCMHLTLSAHLAALCHHVRHVLLSSAKEQVVWSDATLVIAGVAHKQVAGVRYMRLIRSTVRRKVSALKLKLAVTKSVERIRPKPASFRLFCPVKHPALKGAEAEASADALNLASTRSARHALSHQITSFAGVKNTTHQPQSLG